MAETPEPFLGYYPEAELVFALVCPFGVDHSAVTDTFTKYLEQFGYATNRIRISDLFEDLFIKLGLPWEPPSDRPLRAKYKIEAGNKIRETTGTEDILARMAASLIADKRTLIDTPWGKMTKPLPRTAHIVATLKRPEEVKTLRRIYGNGFFLVGVHPSAKTRELYYKEQAINPSDAQVLTELDAGEAAAYGQRTRDTFHLADAFVSVENCSTEVARFLDLVFGCHTETPNLEEQSMYTAYAASLRSGDLSRQVGAAIVDQHGDLLAVGCNDVPRFRGGLYGPEPGSQRDIAKGYDANEKEKSEMVDRIRRALERTDLDLAAVRNALRSTGLLSLTEFGRAVHAEMEAILACARTGRSLRGATLYTTTFPCHNCCRHIIAAGIERVVYIEPYAKSKGPQLHGDAIALDGEPVDGRLPFAPFIGIGPRRYLDLFSLKLSTGYPVEREEKGELKSWVRKDAAPRLQMQPTTYLQREHLASESLNNVLSKSRDHVQTPPAGTQT